MIKIVTMMYDDQNWIESFKNLIIKKRINLSTPILIIFDYLHWLKNYSLRLYMYLDHI